jgi:hydrogenase-4 component B
MSGATLTALIEAGGALLALGALLGWLVPPSVSTARPLSYLASAFGAGLLASAGAGELALGTPVVLHLGVDGLALGHPAGLLDGLSGGFLLLTMGAATLALLASARWSANANGTGGRMAPVAVAALVASVAGVVLAGNGFAFVFAWEGVSVAIFLLVASTRGSMAVARRSWVAGMAARASGMGVIMGCLVLTARTHHLDIALWGTMHSGALLDLAWVALAIGFAAKMGVLPFEAWAPTAYPEVPGPMRAVVAGVAFTIGPYGFLRLMGVLGAPPIGLVVAMVLVGGASALLGVAFAATEDRLARLLAWSSVENGSVILVVLGIAGAGMEARSTIVEAAGFLAAALLTTAHALAKTGTFSALGVLGRTRSGLLDEMPGAWKEAPVATAVLLICSLSLAGLPPSIGFVAEWFVLEALMQQFRLHGLGLHVTIALGAALVALTDGLAALVFIRVAAVGLRRAKGQSPAEGRESRLTSALGTRERYGAGWALVTLGRGGNGAFGLLCLGVAAVSPLEVSLLASVLKVDVASKAINAARLSPFVLEPAAPGFSVLSPSWLWIVLPGLLVVGALFAWWASSGRLLTIRRVERWSSASPLAALSGVEQSTDGVTERASGGVSDGTRRQGPANYRAFGFANPLRHVLAVVLRAEPSLEPGLAQSSDSEIAPYRYSHEVKEPLVSLLYLPVSKGLLAGSRMVKRLQSGRLGAYLAYMLIALVALLAAVRGLH